MDKPFFSIIVPVYNASRYLEDCIMSVLAQENDNYELILVDDGSTDESVGICDAFSNKYEKIKAFHKENKGPIHTRLYGLKHAKGQYVLHLDADDYLEKNTLKYLEQEFRKNQCDCIIFGFRSFADDKVIRTYTVNENKLISDKHEIYLKFFLSFAYNALWRKAYKKDVVDHGDLTNLYYIHKGEDVLLSLGVIKCCKNILFSKEVLYNYRMNAESITHKKGPLPKSIEFTVPEIALEFVRKEADFNTNELDAYRKTRYKESFIPMIKRIVLHDAPIEEKKELFKMIRSTGYYKEFLCKRITHSSNSFGELIALLLFNCGFDNTLILLLQIANKIKHFSRSKRVNE